MTSELVWLCQKETGSLWSPVAAAAQLVDSAAPSPPAAAVVSLSPASSLVCLPAEEQLPQN